MTFLDNQFDPAIESFDFLKSTAEIVAVIATFLEETSLPTTCVVNGIQVTHLDWQPAGESAIKQWYRILGWGTPLNTQEDKASSFTTAWGRIGITQHSDAT
jgi:hypothetical protein